MNLLDSSGWLEYFAEGKNADFFAPIAADIQNVLVPTICIYEVFKVMLRERNKTYALQAVAIMQEGNVITIDEELALEAAIFSHNEKLPMADSIIYTAARINKAKLWTQDADFKNLPNVEFIKA